MGADKPTRAARLREKSGARREQQRADVRRALLDAASELFLVHGLAGFSLRGVAERVGYSATTAYLYFAKKDDLLFAVSLDGFEQFGRALQRAYETTDDPLARIGAIGRAYVAFGAAYRAHYRLMFMERGEFLLKKIPTTKNLPSTPSASLCAPCTRRTPRAGFAPVTRWSWCTPYGPGCTASSP